MGFASGSVSFRRFAVLGSSPESADEQVLATLREFALKERDLGIPEETEYGYSGGRHVLDAVFGFGHNVYVDSLYAALRIDTNRPPASLKRAYTLLEEEAAAAANPSGFISKHQKRETKDAVGRKLEEELRTGRFRRSKLLPFLWDLPAGMLYSPASGKSLEQFMELFERSFDLKLMPLSAGALALRMLEPRGRRRDYEDLRPTRFVTGPEGEGQSPEYPWVSKGPEPKDFVGNEFFLWLWYEAEQRDGSVDIGDRQSVSILIDKSLDLDCAFGQTGRDALRGDGPGRMVEARDGARSGKVPRRMGVTLETFGVQYTLGWAAETLAITGAKFPDVEEAENERTVFEERIGMLRTLNQAVDGLFDTFLKQRCSSAWEGQTGAMRRWIGKNARAAVAMA